MPERKKNIKSSLKIVILQILWIGFFILLITASFIDLIIYYDLKRMVINLFIIISCIISLLAEAYCFKFYSYILFIYTPIGRGLFMTTLTCLELNDNLFSLTICIILFINSVFYLILSALFGGINKPLFNNSLKHKLNLIASVYFINSKKKSKDKDSENDKDIKQKKIHKKNNHHEHTHNHHHHHNHHNNNHSSHDHHNHDHSHNHRHDKTGTIENNSTSSTINEKLTHV